MDDKEPAVDAWPALMGAARTNEQTFSQIQTLMKDGGVEFIEDYSQQNLNGNMNGYMLYFTQQKQVVIGLSVRAILALHQEKMQEAFDSLTACDAASHLAENDPLMIDQLVFYACMAIQVGDCWEALQAGGWTDAQLAQWQHQWDQGDILAAAQAALAMERARGPMMFQQARASRDGLDALLGENSGLKSANEILGDFLMNARAGINELLTSYPRYWGWRWIWSYDDEQRYLELMQSTIEATRDAQKGRSILSSVKDRKTSAKQNPSKTKAFDVAAAAAAENEIFISQALRAQTVANMVTAAIALERFRLAHHAYPDSLAKLAPDYVRSAPVDCMDGHELRYHLNPDGAYLLYSVGSDGVDNGGDPTPEAGKTMGFRNGRDWVWPRPATAEEMQAYEAEQSKPKNHK